MSSSYLPALDQAVSVDFFPILKPNVAFLFDFVSLFSSCYHVTILKCFCKALFNEFFQGMRYTVTVRAFFVHTCSRFCRHFAFESRRISSCRRFLTDSKLISEDMQSILHLWQTVRYLSGHLRSLLLAVRNCSVPSQLRAKIHFKSASPMGFLPSSLCFITVSAASAQTY